MRTLLLSILFVLFMRSLAFAQPADVNRVLRTFDFEERRLGNPEELPMHWLKVEGNGLPHYVNGLLATDRHRSGDYSFRFDLNGGSLIYRYEAGHIKVQPSAHYRVETYVQTTAMPHARTRISGYFTDLDGHPLPETTRHSNLYAAKVEREGWKRLEVELSAESKDAAYLVIELALLQPAQYSPTALGERALFSQDIRGSAWFDDVAVSQVPRVSMTTAYPGNIFRKDDALRLSVVVNDRFTDDLAAQLVIKDATQKVVFQRSGALDMSTAQTLAPGQKRMNLDLPDLPPGWYEAALVMSSQGQYVGEQTLDLVRLADNDKPIGEPDQRFGIVATDLPFAGWPELPDLLPFLSAGRVKLGVWSKSGDIEQVDSDAFDHLLERLQERGIKPTACLLDLPPALAKKVQGDSWLQLLKAPREDWQPQLAYLISRHANHLDRWQLGADGSDAFVTDPRMRKVYAAVYHEFAELVQKPDLAMPWPAWYELDGELPATVALSVPSSVLPQQLPLYMQDLRGTEGHHLSISLELLDRAQYGRDAQIRDIAQRIVYALAGDAGRIDVPLPFTVREENGTIVKQPQEMLLILRTLISTLGGTTFKGQVPIAEGVDAFLFDRNGQGIMVMWSRGSESGAREFAINLGEHPMRMDLWGNTTPLIQENAFARAGAGARNGVRTVASDTPTLKLALSQMPIILLGIDGPLAQLRASVGFDRPLLESSFEPHTRRIRFTNPYKQSISGSFRLKAPAGWVLNPPTFAFSMNPGETFDREVTIEFPYNSFAGNKSIDAEFVVQAERNSAFTVPVPLKLGLSDVGMQTLALRDGDDVIVQQMITNYGEKPIDYSAFAIYPGQARQERLVTNLDPGRTTIKRYRFINVDRKQAVKVRVGVKELVGSRILNDEVEVQ